MAKRFSSDELFELRNRIPINTLIKEILLIPCKTSEGYFRFLCPVCNEFQTATNLATNLGRCFRCEKNFNPIDLVMLVRASDFRQSVAFLKGELARSGRVREMLAAITGSLPDITA